MSRKSPNFGLRDTAGLMCVLFAAVVLVALAFLTHAGPFILIAVLILLIFALLRVFRERGREDEATIVTKALRSRLNKGEKLLAFVAGDRRRVKPLATVADFALMMFTQGLAAEGAGSIAIDDTFVGLTDRRLIAIDYQKRPPGERKSLLERLNLRKRDASKGRHNIVFETPSEGTTASVRLAVFYLARMNIRGADGQTFSMGLNSRYWAERAVKLGEACETTLRLDGHR